METEQALIQCDTTKGPFTMRFFREWSPIGYDRAVELYEKGFFDGSHFFRAVPNFLVQFGITYSTDPELRALMDESIEDDPQLDPPIEFDVGFMSYAGSGQNSRTSQMFIAYGKNANLGTNPWETPFGLVESGMENVISFKSYGDMPPWGKGPDQGKIYSGPEYINENFPLIDKFKTCSVKRLTFGQAGYAKDPTERNKRDLGGDDEIHDELEEEAYDNDDKLEPEEDEQQERIMEKEKINNHRELNRLGGSSGLPLSPKLGLVTVGGLAIVVCVLKSFIQPSRKLNRKQV